MRSIEPKLCLGVIAIAILSCGVDSRRLSKQKATQADDTQADDTQADLARDTDAPQDNGVETSENDGVGDDLTPGDDEAENSSSSHAPGTTNPIPATGGGDPNQSDAGASWDNTSDGGEDPTAPIEVDPFKGRTGTECKQDAECQAADQGQGTCLADWPKGYCSTTCDEFVDCAGTDSTVCREVDGKKRCLLACFADSDCRDHYVCDAELYGCVPK